MTKKRNILGAQPYAQYVASGVKLHRKAAMLAKCYECMGGYNEGREDCLGVSCPLYPYFPYKNCRKRNK